MRVSSLLGLVVACAKPTAPESGGGAPAPLGEPTEQPPAAPRPIGPPNVRVVFQVDERVAVAPPVCDWNMSVTGTERVIGSNGVVTTRVFVKVTDLDGRFGTGLAPPYCDPDAGPVPAWWSVQVVGEPPCDGRVTFRVVEVHEPDAGPIAVVAVNDFSGSIFVAKAEDQVAAGVRALVAEVRPADELAIVDFADHPFVERALAAGKPADLGFLDTVGDRFGGMTAMYDAIDSAVAALRSSNLPAKIVVAFTDGQDNLSMHSESQVTATAGRAGVRLDAIPVGDAELDTLRRMAWATGGQAEPVADFADLVRAYRNAVRTKLDYYVIEFECETAREVEVQLDPASLLAECPNRVALVASAPIETDGVDPTLSTDRPIDATEPEAGPVYFAFNSTVPMSTVVLEGVVSRARELGREAPLLRITGHTDTKGTDAYNDGLARGRAKAVADWLVAHGVPRDLLLVISAGERSPAHPTDYPDEGKAQENRRVDLVWVRSAK